MAGNKEIVWVVGVSGAGKETFIESVLAKPHLRKQLGWENRKVVDCRPSIEIIGQVENDPITKLRDSILTSVPLLLHSSDVVLIKWQHVDNQAGRHDSLRQLTPDANHKVILLNAPEAELIQRLKHKKWWHKYGKEKEHVDDELKDMATFIDRLDTNYDVVSLDSGKSGHYKQT